MNGTYKHKRLFHRFIRLLVMIGMAISVMSIGQYVMAADFDKGMKAYRSSDYATAMAEWRPLAEANHAAAQSNLGLMYYSGYGAPQDYAEALTWYRRAAEVGDAQAQNNLGRMYDRGEGVPQDYVTAYMWYNLAASQKNQPDNHIYIIYLINRETIIKRMTHAQIAEGQRLSRECIARNYKNCAR